VLGLLALDLAWVTVFMRPRYAALVRDVQRGDDMRTRLWPAATAYALMAVGLHAFVLDGAPRGGGVARGALFGAVLYGVYNATAMAVFDRWSASLAAVDVAWGATVYAAAALLARA
jgi:uncharacterized membrane protein